VSFRLAHRILRSLPPSATEFETIVTYRGLKFAVFTGEAFGRLLYYSGEWEPRQESALLGLIRPGSLFFDIGANVGFYTLQAARLGARVVAFEPSRLVISRLTENARLNGFGDAVTIVAEAVSDRAGAIEFFEPRPGNWGVGRVFEYKRPGQSNVKCSVQADTLDTYAERFGIPDVVKIDVEGAEYLALRGAAKVLSCARPPKFVIELHPEELQAAGTTIEKTVAILQDAGYRRTQIAPPGQSPGDASWSLFTREP
jgi:FkbM family methyltransferase